MLHWPLAVRGARNANDTVIFTFPLMPAYRPVPSDRVTGAVADAEKEQVVVLTLGLTELSFLLSATESTMNPPLRSLILTKPPLELGLPVLVTLVVVPESPIAPVITILPVAPLPGVANTLIAPPAGALWAVAPNAAVVPSSSAPSTATPRTAFLIPISTSWVVVKRLGPCAQVVRPAGGYRALRLGLPPASRHDFLACCSHRLSGRSLRTRSALRRARRPRGFRSGDGSYARGGSGATLRLGGIESVRLQPTRSALPPFTIWPVTEDDGRVHAPRLARRALSAAPR